MFTIKIDVTKDNMPALKQALKALTSREVLVGFPAGQDRPRKDGGMTNASLGYLHEHGSLAQRIPPRPFLEPGVASVKDPLEGHLTDAAVAALDGNLAAMDAGFEAVGLVAVSGVKSTITAGIPPPLSPVTLALRRRAGFRGSKPLIRSGQMLNALTYVVKDRK